MASSSYSAECRFVACVSVCASGWSTHLVTISRGRSTVLIFAPWRSSPPTVWLNLVGHRGVYPYVMAVRSVSGETSWEKPGNRCKPATASTLYAWIYCGCIQASYILAIRLANQQQSRDLTHSKIALNSYNRVKTLIIKLYDYPNGSSLT